MPGPFCGRALALTDEPLADEAAIIAAPTIAPSYSTSYSQLLARQVANCLGFSVPLAHSFSHSQTLRRIAMIQKTNPIRRWKQRLALPLLSALLFTVGCLQSPVALAQNTPPATAQTLGTPPPPPPPKYMVDQTPNTPEKVYTYVEKMPQLPGGGGNKSIVEAIQRNVIYPPTALANRKEGRVLVSFYVDSEGHVKEVKIVKGLDPAIDAAVIAAVQKLPRFTPGTQNGKAVTVIFTVPIEFVI